MPRDEAALLKDLYTRRFHEEGDKRGDVWSVLCTDFFQKWVPQDATVLDLAAGHCEFINNIKAKRRIAVDLNPDVANRAGTGVETLVQRSDQLVDVEDSSIDVVFVSNFFEHVPRDTMLSTLVEIKRVLADSGRLLILQPNIRYCARNYWMFFDHITPIDDRALVEALLMAGFDIAKLIPRFLPYTTKSVLPSAGSLVRLYLKVPPIWRIMGAQAFVVATPTGDSLSPGSIDRL